MQRLIKPADAKTLPLPHRLAWACSVVERVGRFFSPHAGRKYYLDEVTAAVWDWTQEGRTARQQCRQLLEKLNEVADHFDSPAVSDAELDEEGYSHGFACLGICLLNEMETDDGGPAFSAAFYAAQCYAAHILFCHGVGEGGAFLRVETLMELARPAHDFAHLAFDTAWTHREERVKREVFAGLPFDASIPQVPREILACVRTQPPMAEIPFLRANGRFVGH